MVETPKQKVVSSMNRPFTEVSKDKRRSPLQRKNPSRCDHNIVFKSYEYPTSGPTWVCVDCHRKTDYPEDFE